MAKKKPGKYAAVIDKLPKWNPVTPEHQDIVDATKQLILDATPASDDPSLKDMTDMITTHIDQLVDIAIHATGGKRYAAEFARVYAELRAVKEKIAEWESNITILLETYQALMIEQMEVEGVSSLKLSNGQPVSTWEEPHATVEDREAFRLWCIKQGLERKMMLPWQTTNMLVKNMLVAGQPEPPGVTIWAKTMIRLSAGGEG